MSRFIYLEGSRAVGKTTLLSNIKKNRPDIIVIDGHARKEFCFDISKYDEFLINEKLYLGCDITQYDILDRENTIVVMVKGPYTDAFFAENFMKKTFDGADIMKSELAEYVRKIREECRPDKIVYLDAPQNVILERYKNDATKARSSMNVFLLDWYDIFEKYFKYNELTTVIDTENKTPDEVYRDFMHAIGEA